jgi:hypothetical protein
LFPSSLTMFICPFVCLSPFSLTIFVVIVVLVLYAILICCVGLEIILDCCTVLLSYSRLLYCSSLLFSIIVLFFSLILDCCTVLLSYSRLLYCSSLLFSIIVLFFSLMIRANEESHKRLQAMEDAFTQLKQVCVFVRRCPY